MAECKLGSLCGEQLGLVACYLTTLGVATSSHLSQAKVISKP